MGPKGTIKAAREYLAGLNLESFVRKTEGEFCVVLDEATSGFLAHLPKGAKHWGAARKFLNIFLRNVVYNRFLCEHCDLYRIEQWLELPLDSQVAKGLREEKGGDALPRWSTVIGLDSNVNRVYQEFATRVAKGKNTYRVHLDILYWRREIIAANNR